LWLLFYCCQENRTVRTTEIADCLGVRPALSGQLIESEAQPSRVAGQFTVTNAHNKGDKKCLVIKKKHLYLDVVKKKPYLIAAKKKPYLIAAKKLIVVKKKSYPIAVKKLIVVKKKSYPIAVKKLIAAKRKHLHLIAVKKQKIKRRCNVRVQKRDASKML